MIHVTEIAFRVYRVAYELFEFLNFGETPCGLARPYRAIVQAYLKYASGAAGSQRVRDLQPVLVRSVKPPATADP